MSDNKFNGMFAEDTQILPELRLNEVIDGETFCLQQPDRSHAYARAGLGIKLTYVDYRLNSSAPDWWILDQPELQLGGRILYPDLAGWERERFPDLPEEGCIEEVPDWVCEVLSESTENRDRTVKMPLYADLGVKHLWMVNPMLRTFEAYELVNKDWNLVTSLQEDDKVRVAPFDEVNFSLGNLWSH